MWLRRVCGHRLNVSFDIVSSVPGATAGLATLGGLVPRCVVRVQARPVGMTWPEVEEALSTPCEACR